MKKVFVDFDGTFQDDIDYLYHEFDIFHEHEPNISMNDWLKMIDWNEVLRKTKPTDGAVEALRKIPAGEITFITTTQSKEELIAKINYLRELGIQQLVVSVPSGISKSVIAPAEGNTLVDDYGKNLKEWKKAGGIAIQFHKTKETGEFPIIHSLSQLVWIIK